MRLNNSTSWGIIWSWLAGQEIRAREEDTQNGNSGDPKSSAQPRE